MFINTARVSWWRLVTRPELLYAWVELYGIFLCVGLITVSLDLCMCSRTVFENLHVANEDIVIVRYAMIIILYIWISERSHELK